LGGCGRCVASETGDGKIPSVEIGFTLPLSSLPFPQLLWHGVNHVVPMAGNRQSKLKIGRVAELRHRHFPVLGILAEAQESVGIRQLDSLHGLMFENQLTVSKPCVGSRAYS
jgi:hypothetical protein